MSGLEITLAVLTICSTGLATLAMAKLQSRKPRGDGDDDADRYDEHLRPCASNRTGPDVNLPSTSNIALRFHTASGGIVLEATTYKQTHPGGGGIVGQSLTVIPSDSDTDIATIVQAVITGAKLRGEW